MKYFSSVRFILILIVLAGILPNLVVVFSAGLERRNNETEHAKRTILRLAEYYAYEQIQEFNRIKTILITLSKTTEVQSLDEAACNELFKYYRSANPTYANFAMIGPDGFAISSALPFKKPKDLSNRKEIIDALKTKRFSIGEYAIGRVSKVQILPVAYPVYNKQGRILCILLASLRLGGYEELFEKAHLPQGSFVGLVDSKGKRLYRYPVVEKKHVGTAIPAQVWDKLIHLKQEGMFTALAGDGRHIIFAARRIQYSAEQEPFLNIFVGTPEKDVLQKADIATIKYVTWAGIAFFLSVTLAYLIGKFAIHNRVKGLVTVAQRLGAGDFSARTGQGEDSGTFGKLFNAFDKMAEQLEQNIVERERGRIAAEKAAILEQANVRLQELDEIKSNLVSSISHELRTPLTSIRGFAKLTGKDFERYFKVLANNPQLEEKGDRICHNLAIIESEGDRLTRLINDFLDINRIEAGKEVWNDASFNPLEIIGKAAEAVSGQFSTNPNLQLLVDLPQSAPEIFADPDKIQQVLINLLNNACKFTKEGTVTVSFKTEGENIVVSVADTGIGIHESELSVIFEKFHKSQSDGAMRSDVRGTGLGLALCKEIVLHYKGNISVESIKDEGSVFTFTLPIATKD
ncbi:HAMP domain-containing protein [Pseudodesulfovibrio cashew]|uniref:histidine kinase n=1 Tax=Pseudodesulfovibrio cashew TaxID=2678688 RepID=A0A6I6JP01_9BACT|nr:ATP-binding protein [Pseudodesulfovibrio cashew]QGY41793.1 HAMP domain-containing protein [Pseudodesulfovibrio cashew]